MRLLPLLLTGLALLSAALPVPARTPAPSSPVPLLWEVRGPGDARLLLLGSSHLLRDSDYPLSADVERAYAAAGRVVFELSPEEMGSPALSRQLLRSALRTDGSRLEPALGPERWARLMDWASGNGMPPVRLQGLQAWFVALTISLQTGAAGGLRADQGMDLHLVRRAGEEGKPALGLESGADQIAVFTGLDPAVQLRMLDEALADATAGGQQAGALHAAWRRGDAEALWQLSGRELQRAPALYAAINTRRNRVWLQRLPRWLADGQGTTLVVVGALHLLGPDGLVEGFRAAGYPVRRICTVVGCPAVRRGGR